MGEWLFQALGATILKARSPNLSVDRGKNKSMFYADLRTVGRVESVKTGCIKLEMFATDGRSVPWLNHVWKRKTAGLAVFMTGVRIVEDVS